MMPAAKHGDPQLGVDIHMCAVPPSPSPVPLPTPHMSILFDPFDYVPIFGATVTVCGMKRATAGTTGIAVHIPPGFPIVPTPKPPEKDDELFMGSATVVADGDPFSYLALPVLSCQIAGMPSIPRIKKKGPKRQLLLPLTVNLAIPTNVFVGGPPTISLMGLAFKGAFAALGRFARSGLFRRARRWLADALGAKQPGFLRCVILRAEPVSILNGAVVMEQADFDLPGRLPIQWSRQYRSDQGHVGWCGRGWMTLADIRLEVDPLDGRVLVHGPGFGLMAFERLPAAIGESAGELELMDGSRLVDLGEVLRVETKNDREYHFPKSLALRGEMGRQQFPIGRIADRCGNALDFQYHGGRPIAIQESAGRRLALTIEQERLVAVTLFDPARKAEHVFVRYEYDQAGDLVAAVDALGAPYHFAYDRHRLVRHTDRRGLSFYYEYAPSGDDWRVIHAWGDGGLYDYRFEYLDALNERRITDSLGQVTLIKLNEAGLPISEIDPLGGMTIFEYDEAGRTTAVVDPAGLRTQYLYDERGNLLKLTRPDGEAIETTFDESNKAIAIADPNGAVWQQKWDARGLLIEQTTPLGNVSRYEYDPHGQLLAFTNPRGARTALAFDHVGNLTSLTDALGYCTRFAYDPLGNVIGKLDPLDHKTLYRYDAKGRLIDARLPSGATIGCRYDGEDNLTSYVDENGAETRLEYLGLGEIKRRIQPDGYSVEYHYDTEERLIGVTNQRGERYALRRDALGRIVEEVDYWGQVRRYAYDASGHLTSSTDPLGRTIEYASDPLGRIVRKALPDPRGGLKPFEETFEYDGNGNLTACANPHIRVERQLDAEGRLLEERQGQGCIVANSYDSNGNRIARTTTRQINGQRHAHTVRYGYDLLDQAIRVEAEGQAPMELTRNALGQLTEESLGTSVKRLIDYSADGYLTAQRVLAGEGPVFDQAYRYDRSGNLIERRDSALGVDQYTYDPLGRLVAHLDPQRRLTQYLNDPAGDRLRTRVSEPRQGEAASDWRRDGEYDGSYYRFDRAGNLTRRRGPDGDLELTWDANQRLIASRNNGKPTIYQYDPLGRRICKQTGDASTYFCWDGDALLGDATVVRDDLRLLRLLREWVYYPETFEPLALVQSHGKETGGEAAPPDLYVYHNDPNGCPTRLLDTRGEVVWAARYAAWGGIERVLTAQVENPIRLQGQYEDRESKFYYNRHRYFDSSIGLYVTQDPFGQSAGENLYAFQKNCFAWIDPLGLVGELAQPGEDLFVGSYSQSTYWNRQTGLRTTHTPHHVVQDAVSGVPHGQGITINLRRDLHAQTRTFGRRPPNLPGGWRSHLAADIMDLRAILRGAGYSREVINRQLRELIRQNRLIRGCGG